MPLYCMTMANFLSKFMDKQVTLPTAGSSDHVSRKKHQPQKVILVLP